MSGMDNDIREALIAICETLKAEAKYLASLQRGLVGFYNAAKSELPNLEARYRGQVIEMEEHPATAEKIQLIDALLEQLKK
jgi:hypothetical protein